MTPQDIENLETGSETDILVIEALNPVINKSPVSLNTDFMRYRLEAGPFTYTLTDFIYTSMETIKSTLIKAISVSTSFYLSMELLQWLDDNGHGFVLNNRKDNNTYHCMLHHYESDYQGFGSAATIPLAICKAFLDLQHTLGKLD